jgi:hypothetical protein
MSRRERVQRSWGTVSVALALATLAALGSQIVARFGRGDVFPPGSTFSSRPDGARLLATALERSAASTDGPTGPEPRVLRATRLAQVRACGADCTLVALRRPWISPDLREFEIWRAALGSGGRLVLAFEPVDETSDCGLCEGSEGVVEGPPADASPARRALPVWWRGLRFDRLASGALGLAELPSGARVLADSHPAASPRVVELPAESGRLVLVFDGERFENQALADAGRRDVETVLATLEPGTRRVAFDEMQLGVTQSGGPLVLARRYGLGGVVLGLLVAGLLYAWSARSATPPLRASRDAAGSAFDGPDAGVIAEANRGTEQKDAGERAALASSGLLALYRRGIPRSMLLRVCLDEGLASVAGHSPTLAAQAAEAEAAVAHAASPAAGFASLRRLFGRPAPSQAGGARLAHEPSDTAERDRR